MSSQAKRADNRRKRLLRGFDRFGARARRRLVVHYDDAFAEEVLAAARLELERLAPEVPDIGGWRNAFTPVMIVNAWGVALHRAMAARGKSAADTVRICAEVSDELLRAMPSFLLRISGRLAFRPFVRRYFERQARRSRQREYPADFVFRVEQSDDGEMSLVFDECAVNKFYEAQGVEELKPYCNFFDVTYSRLMNMGCNAEETIGLGCQTCTLRYKHGRQTAVPRSLEGVLPRA